MILEFTGKELWCLKRALQQYANSDEGQEDVLYWAKIGALEIKVTEELQRRKEHDRT